MSLARRHARARLAREGVAVETVEDAGVVVTELVANAVFHARAPIVLRIRSTPVTIRIEVEDGSSSPPVARSYGTGASTGRGLALVAALAERWGVDPPTDGGGGKVVWAELAAGARRRPHAEPSTTATAAATATSAMPRPDGGRRPVRFLGVPVATYLRLQERNDALLRELELLAFTDGGDLTPEVADAIERSRRWFNGVREGFRGTVLAAASDGRTTIDLDGTGSPAGLRPARELLALFEDVEVLAGDGQLLVAPPDDDIRRLRRWFVDELVAQVDGHEPTHFSS